MPATSPESKPNLVDLAVLLSLVVLAGQFLFEWFVLPYAKDRIRNAESYKRLVSLVRLVIVVLLVAAVVLGAIGYF
jgi:hypothetical protein